MANLCNGASFPVTDMFSLELLASIVCAESEGIRH